MEDISNSLVSEPSRNAGEMFVSSPYVVNHNTIALWVARRRAGRPCDRPMDTTSDNCRRTRHIGNFQFHKFSGTASRRNACAVQKRAARSVHFEELMLRRYFAIRFLWNAISP